MGSPADQARREIEQLEGMRVSATLRADVPALREFFSDNMIWIHATGRADTREEWLDKIGSGRVKYTEMLSEEASYRVFGDTVVVTGHGSTSFVNQAGARTMKMSYTTVYHRFEDGWKNVSMHVARID